MYKARQCQKRHYSEHIWGNKAYRDCSKKRCGKELKLLDKH